MPVAAGADPAIAAWRCPDITRARRVAARSWTPGATHQLRHPTTYRYPATRPVRDTQIVHGLAERRDQRQHRPGPAAGWTAERDRFWSRQLRLRSLLCRPRLRPMQACRKHRVVVADRTVELLLDQAFWRYRGPLYRHWPRAEAGSGSKAAAASTTSRAETAWTDEGLATGPPSDAAPTMLLRHMARRLPECPGVRADLAEAKLTGANLSQAKLTRANLSGRS